MAEFKLDCQTFTLVKLGRLCRSCLREDDKRSIDILKCGEQMVDNVLCFYGIKINENDQKSSLLCTFCYEKLQKWINDKQKATNNQFIVDFLYKRSTNNLIEMDQSTEPPPENNSIDCDKTNVTSESNDLITTSTSTSICPFCYSYDKNAIIDKNSFCKKHSTPYTCLVPKCNLVFPAKDILIPHFRFHLNLGSNTFLCNVCLSVLDCSRNESKKKHVHQNLPKLFQCCSTNFPTMTDFVCHKLLKHNGKIISRKCTNKKVSKIDPLKRNRKRLRKNPRLEAVESAKKLKVDSIIDTSKILETTNSGNTGIFVCKLCPTLFSSLGTFVEHSETIHNISYRFKENGIQLCPLCDENYETSNFVEHIAKCTNSMKVGDDSLNQYGCIHCQQIFSGVTASQFRNHFNYCRSFEVDNIDNHSVKTRKCKNCMFESTNLENCIQHANSYCIYYKLKTKYAKESDEKEKVLDRLKSRQQTLNDIILRYVKPEILLENEENVQIGLSKCDWSRQKFLDNFYYYCNDCKKGFFSCNVFLNHLNCNGMKCRSNNLIYCIRCVKDFDSTDAFINHLPKDPPPPSLPIITEINDVGAYTGDKTLTLLSKSIKLEPSTDELNDSPHFYNEDDNIAMGSTMEIHNQNNLQLADDDEEEIKTFEINNSTIFQESEDSKYDINGVILKESKDLVFNNQLFQDTEVSSDAEVPCTVKMDEDKLNVNILNSLDSFN